MKLSSSPSLRRDLLLFSAVLLLASIFISLRLSLAAHPAEDAAMLMRYSAHLAQGHGIVWNIGEKPVDGATDFLFMVILAGLYKLGFPLETAVVGLGVTAHLLTVTLIFWSVARVEPGNPWLAVLSALLLAAGPGVAYTNAYFGTTTFALAGAVTWHLAARIAPINQPPRWLTLIFAASCLITGLIRPEGVILALLILLGLLVRREGKGGRAILRDVALVFGALGLAYFFWHWVYFGYPLPNPFYKKGAGIFHSEALWASFRNLVEMNQPYVWLLGGILIVVLVKWLPSLRGASVWLPLNYQKIRLGMFALSAVVGMAVVAGLTRRSQPQPGMIFERYSQSYFTLLLLGFGTAVLLLLLALALRRVLPARLRLTWFRSQLAGETRTLALQAGFVLIPVLGFTLVWVLLSNEMNFLGRFQYPLVPLILMGNATLLSILVQRWFRLGGYYRLVGWVLIETLIIVGLLFTLNRGIESNYPDGRFNVAMMLRSYADKNYTMATSEAGILPFYSTWRAVDTWGLNDQWITHTGEITEAYLERYQPELIVFHANLQFTEKDPQTAWDWMTRRLWSYARERGYVLAAAFGSRQDDYHYYYVRPNFEDAPAIISYLREMDYPWYENGQLAVNYAPKQP